MSSHKPTAVLIIHGAYFLPSAWDKFNARLSQAGFTVRCPRLPSCGDARPATATLEHDSKAVKAAAKELIDAGHNILVLAHSYGGIVASETISPDLYASNDKNGIVALVLLSAWLVQPNDSVEGVIAKHGFQCQVDLRNNGDGTVFAKNAPDSFYNDIDASTAEHLARSNVTHNWGAVAGKLTAAPWMDLPTTYVHCTWDLAIMLPLQERMVQDAVDAGGTTPLVRESIDAGHCPFLSKPEKVMRVLERVVARIV